MALTVVGGSNFLGRFLIKNLWKNYQEVRLADMYPFREAVYQLQEEVPIAKHPLLYPTNLKQALDGAKDVIVVTHDFFKLSHSKLFYLERTAEFAKKLGVNKLYWVAPLELDQLNGLDGDPHELIKHSEQLVERTFPDISILKTNLIFGEACTSLILQHALYCIANNKPVVTNNKGLSKFCPVWDQEVLETLNELQPGQKIKLGGPQVLNWEQICNVLAEHSNSPAPSHGSSLAQKVATNDYLGDLFYPSHIQQMYRLLSYDHLPNAKKWGEKKLQEVFTPGSFKGVKELNWHRVVID